MPQGVKLKETRFADKLYGHLTNRLFRGQTGFVPGMGCLVNQVRAINRIKLRTENPNKKQVVYGLFIDFSSAYNTILHTKLFERLEQVLDKKEIEYLKALYSRNRIKLGEYSFTPNIGVAQGSIISPALFDIYIEDLLKKIENLGVNIEDIFAYADDVLILCSSLDEVKRVIDFIRKWSLENNLFINEKKSGIVPFQQRRGKEMSKFTLFEEKTIINNKTGKSKTIKVPKTQTYEGFPVLHEYKYLGLWLTYRLQMKHQNQHIREKTRYIATKLYPMLTHCSLETRTNLWTILCRPLIEQTFALFEAEHSKSNKKLILGTIRTTFRKMTLISTRVENAVIEKFMNYDFIGRCNESVRKAKQKWEQRMGRSVQDHQIGIPNQGRGTEEKTKNLMPKELVEYTNLLTAKCTKCPQTIIRTTHLEQKHNIKVPNAIELWGYFRKDHNP